MNICHNDQSTTGLSNNSTRAQTTSSTKKNTFKSENSAIDTKSIQSSKYVHKQELLNVDDCTSVELGTKAVLPQKGRKRQKSQEGFKVSDVCSNNEPVGYKRLKSEEYSGGQSYEGSGAVKEVLPKKAVGRSSKDMPVPSTMSGQRTEGLGTKKETLTKKAVTRKSKDVPEPSTISGQRTEGLGTKKETLPKKAVRRKSEDVPVPIAISGHCPEVSGTEKEILPQKTVRRKSKDVPVPITISGHSCEVSGTEQEILPQKAVRRKSKDVPVPMAISGQRTEGLDTKKETLLKKAVGRKSKNDPVPITIPSQINEESGTENKTSPIQDVRQKSQEIHVPSSISVHCQLIKCTEGVPILRAVRRSSRLKSKEDMESNADNVMSQSVTLNKDVRRCKSKDAFVHNAVSSSVCDLNILRVTQDGEKFRDEQKMVKEHISPENNESKQKPIDCPMASDVPPATIKTVEGELHNSIEVNHSDFNTMEDLAFNTPTSSPESFSDCSPTNYESEEEQDDNLEGIIQHIQNPTFELADSSKLVRVDINQSTTSVESMLASPVSETGNENETLSTICDIAVESDLVNVSPIKKCNIVVKRLDSRENSKFNTTNKQLKKDYASCKDGCGNPALSETNCSAYSVSGQNQIQSNRLLPEAQDILSDIVKPRVDEQNYKEVSILNPTVTNQKTISQPLRPKLNKASILKRKVKTKCLNVKQKKTNTNTNNVNWSGLDRTVALHGDKHLMVITKKFNEPKVQKEIVKLKLHENNDSAVKRQNLQNTHGQTTNRTYITFNDNSNQSHKQFKNTPPNVEVTQLKTFKDKHLQTSTSELSLRNRITLKEKDSFDKFATHNYPLSSPCGTNIRSNLQVDTELRIQEKEPLSDFSFALPKALPTRQKVVQSNEDDDDVSSVMSLFISKEIENDIHNEKPEPNKTSWTKFDRLSKHSSDEEDECNTVINSTCNNEAGLSGTKDTDAEIPFEERNNLYATSPLTVEKVACWNQLNQKYISEERDQAKRAISRRLPKEHNFCDDLLVTDPLEDSPFKGYCILYFRASIDEHTCILMHEVPYHIFSDVNTSQDVNRTEWAIGEIIKENFINPPVELVLSFVSFCMRFSKKTTLVRLGECLKNNYDGDKEKAHEIWYNFFKAIIDAKYSAMPNIHKCRFISMTLRTIFGEGVYTEVFTVVLKALVTLQTYFKSQVQLLMCIQFLFERGQRTNSTTVKRIPLEFATSVLNQCLDTMSQINKTSKSFAFKVFKTFFTDLDYAKSLYSYDKYVFTLFVETVESNNIVNLSQYFSIKQLLMSGLETSSLENLRRAESGSPRRHLSTNICSDRPIQQRQTCRRTIECASDPNSLSAALERNFEIGALNPNEIYNWFKSPFRNELFYTALTLLRDPVKKSLSDVIMSLISYEANNNRWNVCLKLYNSLLYFDPCTIKNFDGINSPVSNILTIVLVFLKNNKTTDALNLFTKYNLCKDYADWELDCFPHDLERRMLICSTFKYDLQQIDDESLYDSVMKLIPLQKSLAEPIDLTVHVSIVINGLIEKRLDSKAAKLLALIFDENKMKLFLLPSANLYRALVVILCNERDLIHASMLLFKAEKRVLLYPTLPKRIADIAREMPVELYSCLTKQEMLVAFFALLKLYGDKMKYTGFSVAFKVYCKPTEEDLPCVFKPYLSVKDDSIPTAIRRFKEAVRELIPNAIFRESSVQGNHSIEIEKISLQEYMYNLN